MDRIMRSGQEMFNEMINNASKTTKDSGHIIGDSMKEVFKRVDKVETQPTIDKEKLVEKLYNYFGFNSKDGTYIYNLTRVKSAFNVGTMTLDDFEEIDDDFIYGLADFILEIIKEEN